MKENDDWLAGDPSSTLSKIVRQGPPDNALSLDELLGYPAPCKHRRAQYDAASNSLFCWDCCQEVDGAIA